MTTTIAIAGKGGTGKTTVAALLIKYIVDHGLGSVLAIDADPSSNLHLVLGVELAHTVGDVREDMLSQISAGTYPTDIPKPQYLEYKINQALVEGPCFDLLAMGRPEGPGCYCAANYMLRLCVDRLAGTYDYVVMDNEAGLEHLSRRTTCDVDILLIVTDPTMRGLTAAERIVQLIAELKTRVSATYLIVNRIDGDLIAPLQKAIEALGVELIAMLPHDPQVSRFDSLGRPLVEMDSNSAIYQEIKEMAQRLAGGMVK